jgi:hypothetical protein
VGLAEFDAFISKIQQIGKASLESYENKKLYMKFESVLEILSKYFSLIFLECFSQA